MYTSVRYCNNTIRSGSAEHFVCTPDGPDAYLDVIPFAHVSIPDGIPGETVSTSGRQLRRC
jgi:hypothetical protein